MVNKMVNKMVTLGTWATDWLGWDNTLTAVAFFCANCCFLGTKMHIMQMTKGGSFLLDDLQAILSPETNKKHQFMAGRLTLFDRNRDAGDEISRWIRYQHRDACRESEQEEKLDVFLERSSVRIKLCTIMYNYICIYITHNTYNIYIYIIIYPYMDYIKRQKKVKNT